MASGVWSQARRRGHQGALGPERLCQHGSRSAVEAARHPPGDPGRLHRQHLCRVNRAICHGARLPRHARQGCHRGLQQGRHACGACGQCADVCARDHDDVRAHRDPGRQGFFWPIARNPNRDRLFSRKPRGTSHLAFSSSFGGFRLFASVFVLCQRNDTRNDTRREGLRDFLGKDLRSGPRRVSTGSGSLTV